MSTKATDLAELEQHAQEVNDKLAARRAEQHRADQERAAKRDALTAAWWEQRLHTFIDRVGGKRDAAWAVFVDAVRSGGDTVAAWREYRVTVRQWHDDLTSWQQQRDERERREHRHAEAHWSRVTEEGRVLGQIQVPRDLGADQYEQRLTAWRDDAEAWLGRALTDAELDQVVHGKLPMHRLIGLAPIRPRGLGTPDSALRDRADSYAQAVDLVVAQLEAEAEQQAAADREREREAYIAEHLGA